MAAPRLIKLSLLSAFFHRHPWPTKDKDQRHRMFTRMPIGLAAASARRHPDPPPFPSLPSSFGSLCGKGCRVKLPYAARDCCRCAATAWIPLVDQANPHSRGRSPTGRWPGSVGSLRKLPAQLCLVLGGTILECLPWPNTARCGCVQALPSSFGECPSETLPANGYGVKVRFARPTTSQHTHQQQHAK
jgi:hypothetical protein